MTENRPHGRQRNVTGSGNVYKRGEGLHTGPVGNSSRPSGSNRSGGGGSRSPFSILIILAMLLFGGHYGLGNLSSGSSTGTTSTYSSSYPSGWTYGNNMTSTSGSYATQTISDSAADYTVSKSARAKYTDVANADSATVLVYMCGADLESRSGMATKDLQEMINATHSDKVKIIIETGGAKNWQNNLVSANCLQRWQVVDGGLAALNKNVGNASMTDVSTLKDFVEWGFANYRSDRMMLILWDHGGGSVSGYGHDENFNNGTMRIDQLAGALSKEKKSFDFIGYDACLMATLENAIAMEPYSDYLIASEETEPGTGWYYTDWLTQLAKDPSTATVDLGKTIIDTFTAHSTGSTTLSITDLAELSGTVGEPLKNFSTKLQDDIQTDSAKEVANARAGAKEFARSYAIDQVDLTDFANKLDTSEGKKLAEVIQSAVKYNRTQNISNAYGLSVYFPYRNNRLVSKMTDINNAIDMDSDYTGAMRSFATLNASAQSATSYSSSSIFDLLGGAAPSSGSSMDANSIFNALSSGGFDLSSLLGGTSGIDTNSFSSVSQILGRNSLAADALEYSTVNGKTVLALSESEWSDIHEINLNVWVDDGEGYIDLGYDNIYDFDTDGNLIADYDGNWIALDGHPAAVYTTDSEYRSDGGYVFHSYIPAMLNGEQVRILLEYSDQNENGIILGAEKVYDSDTAGKGLIDIQAGDVIDLLCDYYDYSGNYSDTYYLGEEFTVGDSLQLSDVALTNNSYLYGYALKDTWNTTRYTPFLTK